MTVEGRQAASLALRLSYAQPGASWTPSYEATMDPGSAEVTLAMFGWVKQATGES